MAYYIDKKRLNIGVEIHKENKVYEGYTLFAPMFDKNAWLIDMEGNIVHNWKMKNPPGVYGRLLPNGNLMWMDRGPDSIPELTGAASAIIEVDWDGNEIWRYDDPYINHDFLCLPNGNLMLMRFKMLPEEVQKKIKSGIKGSGYRRFGNKTLSNNIIEITRDGDVVWEWNHWEHFDPEKDVECPLGTKMVWGYTNSFDIFPNGDLLISVRHLNTIARISKKTGEIIWRWGPEQMVGHQHCVSVLDNGNIMLFDNGLHRNPPAVKSDDYGQIGACESSRILEVNPETNEIVWQFNDPANQFYTQYCGSAERLPNGNTLICESIKGTFFEVTPEKEVVWKYVHPFAIPRPNFFGWTINFMVFQIRRYGIDFEGLKGKELKADNYKLTVERSSSEEIEESKKIMDRLARAGY
jgi:hypothetical protein